MTILKDTEPTMAIAAFRVGSSIKIDSIAEAGGRVLISSM